MKSRARRLARKGGSWWSRAQIDERPRNGWRRCFFAGHLRIPVNGFGSFVERSPPQRAKTVGRRLFTTWRRPTKAAPRASRNPPYLPRGGGGGYTRRIYYGLTPTDGFLRCQTGWENREDRARHFQPLLPPPFLPRMRRYDTAINFPGSRALFHHSRRHFENSVERQFPRVYICISLRDEITYIFWRREGIACAGRREGVREKTLSLPFFFRRKRVGASRTVAVGPRVRFACNRIAMLILSLLRGYVERERERERGRDLRVSYLSYPETSSSSSSSCRPAGCPFPVLIPFIAN